MVTCVCVCDLERPIPLLVVVGFTRFIFGYFVVPFSFRDDSDDDYFFRLLSLVSLGSVGK